MYAQPDNQSLQIQENIAENLRNIKLIQEEQMRLQEKQISQQDSANLIAFYSALKQENNSTSSAAHSTVRELEHRINAQLGI